MELYLQFGYGMMEHCRILLSQWGGGAVIMSPRDLNPSQLRSFAADIGSLGDSSSVLLDPQFYLPHADHERLCSHEYWPDEYDTDFFWQGPGLNRLITQLNQLNNDLRCSFFILPGLLATQIDDDWLVIQESIIEEAQRLEQRIPILVTVALSGNVVCSQDQVGQLLDRSESWNPQGFYLVFEHPQGQYLVDNPNWLANVLDIVAGFKLRGMKVVVGYCNQQMLILSAAKADVIASGTWMNVRSFPPEKFRSVMDEEIRQRATWYYCHQSLSEYKIPFLDIAFRQGILNDMAPSNELDGGYVRELFSGAQPTSINFREQTAFRHYLHCLHEQALSSSTDTFDENITFHQNLLDSAEVLLRSLRGASVSGQHRDFREMIDVNRAALTILLNTRGPMLRRAWASI